MGMKNLFLGSLFILPFANYLPLPLKGKPCFILKSPEVKWPCILSCIWTCGTAVMHLDVWHCCLAFGRVALKSCIWTCGTAVLHLDVWHCSWIILCSIKLIANNSTRTIKFSLPLIAGGWKSCHSRRIPFLTCSGRHHWAKLKSLWAKHFPKLSKDNGCSTVVGHRPVERNSWVRYLIPAGCRAFFFSFYPSVVCP